MTRFFYDTEFIENGRTIDLISIGIVSEHDDTYYAVVADAPWNRIHDHDWLMANVWPHLPIAGYTTQLTGGGDNIRSVMKDRGHLDTTDTRVKPRWVIANEVRQFLTKDIDGDQWAELWADYGAYDHIALMQLWGPMIRRPAGLPMFTHDIQQWAASLGVRDQLPKHTGTAHDALSDAEHVKAQWTWLNNYPAPLDVVDEGDGINH